MFSADCYPFNLVFPLKVVILILR